MNPSKITLLANLLQIIEGREDLSQKAVADMAGVSKSYLSQLLHNKRNMDLELFLRILDVCGIPLASMIIPNGNGKIAVMPRPCQVSEGPAMQRVMAAVAEVCEMDPTEMDHLLAYLELVKRRIRSHSTPAAKKKVASHRRGRTGK